MSSQQPRDEASDHHNPLDALRVPAEIVEQELSTKSPARRALEIGISLVLTVLLFAFAIPAITGTQYREIFEQFGQLDAWSLLALSLVWILVMLTYTGVLTTALPGLTHPQALVLNLGGSAVSNVVPFGGAAGVAATYAMAMSWGFGAPAVTLSILVSGIWNVFTKLGLPILALVFLVAFGHASDELIVPAAIGVVLLSVGIAALVLVLRSEQLAARVGGLVELAASPAAKVLGRPIRVKAGIVEFRQRSIGLLRTRWLKLTVWMLAYNAGQYLILLMCVRALGAGTDDLGWVEVLGAFAFANLLTTISITPSGVGFVEAGTVAALIAFGGPEAASAAAVLLFRGFTYLLEIPVGAAAWVVWTTKGSWRRDPALRDEPA